MAIEDMAVPQQARPNPNAGMGDPEATGAGASVFGESEQASPEEQAAYTEFVSQAMTLIWDKKVYPQLLKMMAEDPVEGLAQATAQMVARVATSGEKAGREFSGDVVFHAGKEILEEIADLARVGKVKDFGEDPDALEGAWFRAVDAFRVLMESAGRVDQEAAKQDLAKLQAADESGALKENLIEMARRDAEQGKQGTPQGEPQEDPGTPPRRGLMAQEG